MSEALQIGLGRVSRTQAPSLQYFPSPHWASLVQTETQLPLTHFGVVPEQSASFLQTAWVGSGSQTPLVHVRPGPQGGEALHVFTHCPLAHASPLLHSLENLQVLPGAVHTPPAHWSPLEQSALDAQGQGPFVPPQASHLLATQTPPFGQSPLVVHSFVGVPPSEAGPGGAQRPFVQTVPRSQSVEL